MQYALRPSPDRYRNKTLYLQAFFALIATYKGVYKSRQTI
jgi:hypothetical protein